jgi:hypothetical protein
MQEWRSSRNKIRTIINLGEIELRPLYLETVMRATDEAEQVEDARCADVFTDFVLAEMLVDPALAGQVASFSTETLEELAAIAAEELGCQAHFQQLHEFPPRMRLHQAFLKSLEFQAEQISRAISSSLDPLMKTIRTVIAPQLEQMAKSYQSVMERLRLEIQQGPFHERILSASKAVSNPIQQAGFWLPPSAPFGLLFALEGLLSESQPSVQEVRRVIVEQSRRGDYRLLRKMVNSWESNRYFIRRVTIVRDALDAHIDGKYTLTIPTLLPIAEGVLRGMTGDPTSGVGRLLRETIEQHSGSRAFLRELFVDAVLASVTYHKMFERVGDRFTPQAFPGWLKEHNLDATQTLQRNAILHGVQVDYASEENSLRAFFLLDTLAHLD